MRANEENGMRWERGNRYGGIEDRRGMGGGIGLAGGGIGAAVLGLAGYLFFGINPFVIMQAVDQLGPATQQEGRTGTPTDRMGQFVDTILSSTTDVWRAQFQQMGKSYTPPNPLVIYEQATGTQCGLGQAAMGPFYCPRDSRVYLDLQFFEELSGRFGAPGDFAQAYVLAHEVGHHVQNLLGTSGRVERAERNAGSAAEANRYSVALELQADCFAGVWAAHASEVSGGRVALEPGDLEEGLRAAAAVGDDTLQRETQGRVVPDSFTHGSAAERQRWLRTGYNSGNPDSCDTFAGR
jgi:predicted metalloprotease